MGKDFKRAMKGARPAEKCSFALESALWETGARHIAGVDEVGRGPLFGPVVAAAVVLPEDFVLMGLTDSKKLTEATRERFNGEIRAAALSWAIAEVDVATIDRINILQASLLAMRLAVEQLHPAPDFLLIDGNKRIDWAGCGQRTIVKGDARSLSIAAASVLAKVHRDRMLCELAERYPGYGLERNKGYGSAEHMRALVRLGVTAEHRRSYRPVREALAANPSQGSLTF